MITTSYKDPEKLIAGIDRSCCMFAKWNKDNITNETAFFVQEYQPYLDKFGRFPSINLRAGLIINDKKIGIIPIMFLINYNYDLLYETTLNVHQSDGKGFDYLDDFCTQAKILFCFYEGSERKRSIKIKNKWHGDFQRIRTKVEKLPEWSMADFDKAKEQMHQDFSSPVKLFNALEGELEYSLFN